MAKQLTIQSGVIILVIAIATFLANQGTMLFGRGNSSGVLQEKVSTLEKTDIAHDVAIKKVEDRIDASDNVQGQMLIEQRVLQDTMREVRSDVKKLLER